MFIKKGQILVADTLSRKMYVYDDGKLLKIIDDVWLGKNGTSLEENMHEGGMKTPIGEYNLGISFGTMNIQINYPYIQIDSNSYWVDDVNSNYYNYFVQIGNEVPKFNYQYVISMRDKDFESAEHLIDYPLEYKCAVYIEYNAHNIIPGKGSAIFLHCHGTKGYTGGCLSISENDMIWIIRYLDVNKNPKIIIK